MTRRCSGTRTRWLPASSLGKGTSLAGAEFFQSLLAQLVEFAQADVGFDLLVPKLSFVFPEPPAKLEDLRRRELLNLINDFCHTHVAKVCGSGRLSMEWCDAVNPALATQPSRLLPINSYR